MPQSELCSLVCKLCQGRRFTADEIATLLGKTRKYTLDRLLTPLQQQGLLKLTIPDQPNHPDQAYTASPDV